jgi:hypothetical protein
MTGKLPDRVAIARKKSAAIRTTDEFQIWFDFRWNIASREANTRRKQNAYVNQILKDAVHLNVNLNEFVYINLVIVQMRK